MRARRAGFTLIEVLMAVVIMGLAAISLLLIQAQSLERAGDADRLRTLRLLASSQLRELQAASDPTSRGRFDKPFEDYVWTFTERQEDWEEPRHEASGLGGNPVPMRKGTLTVTAPDGRTQLVVVVYRGPPKAPAAPEAGGGR